MAFGIYKSGQGYWTRMGTAWGTAILVLSGCAWLFDELKLVRHNTIYWQAGCIAAVVLFFSVFTYWLLNKPRVADFMIATEAEMKKVNWPSRREIVGSTWVVICGTFLIAALLFVVDLIFAGIFRQIGVLKGG